MTGEKEKKIDFAYNHAVRDELNAGTYKSNEPVSAYKADGVDLTKCGTDVAGGAKKPASTTDPKSAKPEEAKPGEPAEPAKPDEKKGGKFPIPSDYVGLYKCLQECETSADREFYAQLFRDNVTNRWARAGYYVGQDLQDIFDYTLGEMVRHGRKPNFSIEEIGEYQQRARITRAVMECADEQATKKEMAAQPSAPEKSAAPAQAPAQAPAEQPAAKAREAESEAPEARKVKIRKGGRGIGQITIDYDAFVKLEKYNKNLFKGVSKWYDMDYFMRRDITFYGVSDKIDEIADAAKELRDKTESVPTQSRKMGQVTIDYGVYKKLKKTDKDLFKHVRIEKNWDWFMGRKATLYGRLENIEEINNKAVEFGTSSYIVDAEEARKLVQAPETPEEEIPVPEQNEETMGEVLEDAGIEAEIKHDGATPKIFKLGGDTVEVDHENGYETLASRKIRMPCPAESDKKGIVDDKNKNMSFSTRLDDVEPDEYGAAAPKEKVGEIENIYKKYMPSPAATAVQQGKPIELEPSEEPEDFEHVPEPKPMEALKTEPVTPQPIPPAEQPQEPVEAKLGDEIKPTDAIDDMAKEKPKSHKDDELYEKLDPELRELTYEE